MRKNTFAFLLTCMLTLASCAQNEAQNKMSEATTMVKSWGDQVISKAQAGTAEAQVNGKISNPTYRMRVSAGIAGVVDAEIGVTGVEMDGSMKAAGQAQNIAEGMGQPDSRLYMERKAELTSKRIEQLEKVVLDLVDAVKATRPAEVPGTSQPVK